MMQRYHRLAYRFAQWRRERKRFWSDETIAAHPWHFSDAPWPGP